MNNSIYFLLFSILLMLGTHLYLMDPKRLFNRLNAVVLFLCAGLVTTEWSIYNAHHYYDVANYASYHTIFIGGIMVVEAICAYFFAQPFEDHPKEKKIDKLVVVGLLVSFITVFSIFSSLGLASVLEEKIDDKWRYIVDENTSFTKVLGLWYLAMILLTSYFFWIAYKKATIKREKNWKFWLFASFTSIPLLGYFLFVVFPHNDIPSTYEVSPFLFVLVSILSWVFSNFKLFELEPNDAINSILDSVSNIVIIADIDFKAKHINELANETLFSNQENEKQNILDIFKKSEGFNLVDFLENILKLKEGEKYEYNFLLNRPEGEKNYLLVVTKIIRKQTHIGYSFVGTDITSIIEKEKQLKDYNEQLENKNQELERFAYIASHDLKTPLRNVTSFLSLLKRKLKSNPDPDINDFINIAQSNAQSMYNLIEEILEYSLVKSDEVKTTKVDMNEVLFLIEKNLSHHLKEKGATIKYSTLPIIEANHHQMVQLFQNLIENGLKYNVSNQPKVTISMFQENEYLVFKVEDNGIGINPEYHKTIFEIFKRLHNQSEYQGSGVGLAICNKIVTNHGGFVDLISVENVGSIFMVHLNVVIHNFEPVEMLESLKLN